MHSWNVDVGFRVHYFDRIDTILVLFGSTKGIALEIDNNGNIICLAIVTPIVRLCLLVA